MATPLDSSLVNPSDFPITWDGSPAKFVEKASLQTFSLFQLFWFAGNNLCDSATKSRIESQLSQREGKTVTCSATTGLNAFVGTCDWWCDVQAAGGINCQGDSNKCSIQDKCVNNQCVPVTCSSTQYVSNHQCNEKLPTQTCTDSDGGDKPLSKGSTYLNGNFVATDQCSSDGRQLQEKYCSGTITNSRVYSCTYGCSGGACLEQKITSCTGKPDGTIITSYCDGNTAKKSVCFGQVEQVAQNSCSNIGKTCAAGECVTPSGTGGGSDGVGDGGGTGGTGGTGGGGGTQVCCQNVDKALYVRNSAAECDNRLFGLAGKDPVVDLAIADCKGTGAGTGTGTGCAAGEIKQPDGTCKKSTGGTTCAADEVKQADGTCKKKVSSGTFGVEVNSIPSLEGAISSASEGEVLESLCLLNLMCESNSCDESRENRDEIDSITPIGRFDSSLGEVRNGGFEPLKTNQDISLVSSTEGTSKPFKEGTAIEGVCREKVEKFDSEKFFKDNQTAILIGGGILGFFLLYSMVKK